MQQLEIMASRGDMYQVKPTFAHVISQIIVTVIQEYVNKAKWKSSPSICNLVCFVNLQSI